MVAGVVLAGGRGTRMRPLSDRLAKPLLPVGGVPVLARQVRRLAAAGIGEVVVSAGHRADDLRAALPDLGGLGATVRLAVEDAPLGTGGGLRHALGALLAAGSMPELLVVTNGDLLTGHDLPAQLAALAPDADGVVHVRTVPDARPYGCVETDGDVITSFREKDPDPPTTEVNAGTYVLRTSAVLAHLRPGAASSLERDLLPRLAGTGRLRAYREQAPFVDVGTPEALLTASVDAVLAGAAPTSATWPAAVVGPGAQIAEDALLDGGSALGRDVVVGTGAVVRGSVLLDGVVVAAGASVIDSALAQDVVVGTGARLERCAVGAGTAIPPEARWSDVTTA